MRPWLALFVLVPTMTLARADALDQSPSKFAKSGDLKVHYKSIGEGKTAVVFVHGWCCDHTVWRDQAAALAGKARTIYIDLPGYGQSDKPKMDYTMDVFARGVDAVLQDAGVEQAAVHPHLPEVPPLPLRVHPQRDRGAARERAEKELHGGGAGVGAALRGRLVGDDGVRARPDGDGIPGLAARVRG